MLVNWTPPGKTDMQQNGKLQDRKLERELNFEEQEKVHLRCTHWEQMQHCTHLPLQGHIALVGTHRTGKDKTRIWINIDAHQK